ncbi:MAG TPA: hypothetical protein VI875_04130 [Candidatus Norongarragalinales archaeon]|nr:hypothetical protein [Candidatus Norongarragalinales archaeon]
MKTKIFVALVMLALALTLAGCLTQQAPVKKTATATPTPTPTPSPEALPSPTKKPSPTPTPTPSPEANPECTITVNPNDAQGPFKAGVSARFFNIDPANATIKCTNSDTGVNGEKKEGSQFFRTCDYPSVQVRKIETASASAQGVSCETLVVVGTNTEYKKSWSFSPADESFTMNKSVSNSTTRNYTIQNSGTLELNTFTCMADKSFVTMVCPEKIAPGASAPANATFSISAQPDGAQNVVLTITEKDLQKTITVTVNIVS